MQRLASVLLALTLFGCNLMTPFVGGEAVLGMPVLDTVLIVEEQFELDGDVLPAGVYYPHRGSTSGWILYLGSRPLTVKRFFQTLTCAGGVQVNSKKPYEDYDLFYYGCGDPVTAIHIPKTLRFRIEPRSGVRLPRASASVGAPNPSIDRTPSGRLRLPAVTAHVER